ncbi:MAG: PorT family protein [Flavobacteriaceae bacterium]|nr:PorT family protein [Flavobacteriaceae bacterium]
MKKHLVVIVFILSSTFLFSQVKFGFKGGVNYNFSGNITEVINSGDIIDVTHGANNKAGFHLGIWTRFGLAGFSLRPELVYTEIKNEYQLNSSTTLKTKKIDIPILLDKKFGPLHLFGGPSFQYILKSNFKTTDIGSVNFNKFSLGTQVGVGLEFGNFGIDARWEKGFSNNLTAILISSLSNLNLDNRPNQIIFSVSYNLL